MNGNDPPPYTNHLPNTNKVGSNDSDDPDTGRVLRSQNKTVTFKSATDPAISKY